MSSLPRKTGSQIARLTAMMIGAMATSYGLTQASMRAVEPGEGSRRLAFTGSRYETELATLDRAIAACIGRAEALPKSWLARERVAQEYMTRAQLTGDYDDYTQAELWLELAFQTAGERSGPFLTRAALNYTLHRLDRVEPDLAMVERRFLVSWTERTRVAVMRANLAFQQGRYAEAHDAFERAVAEHPDLPSRMGLAQFLWKSGDFDRAAQLIEEAQSQCLSDAHSARAWLHLQRGLMDLDRGRFEGALGHYRDAQAELADWWLVEEHIAEVTRLLGDHESALRMYEDLIARTQNPEFMDAMADICAASGDKTAAAAWVIRAREIYRRRSEQFPEAAAGHALAHWLDHEADADRALVMARENHALRPNAEAKINLARALLKSGRAGEALAVIRQALETPWDTAELHATAAEALAATGNVAEAERQRMRALAINPHLR